MLLGFGALGIQAFLYLLNEEWIEIPLLYITSFGPSEFTSWLDNPALDSSSYDRLRNFGLCFISSDLDIGGNGDGRV